MLIVVGREATVGGVASGAPKCNGVSKAQELGCAVQYLRDFGGGRKVAWEALGVDLGNWVPTIRPTLGMEHCL